MLKKWNLQQVFVYSLAIIMWVNDFQTPKIQFVLSSFFREGNDIAHGSIRITPTKSFTHKLLVGHAIPQVTPTSLSHNMTLDQP